MRQALRPYATAGVAIVGAGLVAVTPVATPLSALSDIQSRGVQLTAGGFADVLSEASANFTQLYNNFALAPFVGMQQFIVNIQGLLGELQNGTDPSTVLAEFQADLTSIASAFTLTNAGMDDADFTTLVGQVTKHTLDNYNDLSGLLTTHDLTIGHTLLESVLPSFLPADVDPDMVSGIVHFLSSPLSGMIMGGLGPLLSPIVALINSIADGDSFEQILASPLDGLLNGATLNLDSLIPVIESAGLLPEGATINSLDFALGGLLTPGTVGAGPYADAAGDAVTPVGGSIFSSLGLNLTVPDALGIPGPFTIDVPSYAVGPLGAAVGWEQAMGAVLGDGWDGKNATQDPPIFALDPIPPGGADAGVISDGLLGLMGLDDSFSL
jgi:hypothetical protein